MSVYLYIYLSSLVLSNLIYSNLIFVLKDPKNATELVVVPRKPLLPSRSVGALEQLLVATRPLQEVTGLS